MLVDSAHTYNMFALLAESGQEAGPGYEAQSPSSVAYFLKSGLPPKGSIIIQIYSTSCYLLGGHFTAVPQHAPNLDTQRFSLLGVLEPIFPWDPHCLPSKGISNSFTTVQSLAASALA